MERSQVAVVGAGQAGLATSYWLAQRDIDHVLLERDRPGDSWRDRWDSFCLVTPNWTLNLPGFPYDGDDPNGFIPRDAIADYVARYREFLDAPVHGPTDVLSLDRSADGWMLTTDNGDWVAESVVVATGAFPFPSRPRLADAIAPDVVQLHSQRYRRASALPEGGVLVVGSGQSGAQIVDDLVIAGREVWFAIGRSGHVPRRYRGRDTTQWLAEVGFMDMPISDPAMRDRPSMMVSGRDGGKNLNLRAFGRDGVHLVGRILEADHTTLRFSDDVEDVVDGADAVSVGVQALIDEYIAEHGIDAPPPSGASIDWVPSPTPTQLDVGSTGINTVVWATGYHYDFSWIGANVFDNRGSPIQQRGATREPGLYFIGLHGMHTVGSGLFFGVGADAKHVVTHISEATE